MLQALNYTRFTAKIKPPAKFGQKRHDKAHKIVSNQQDSDTKNLVLFQFQSIKVYGATQNKKYLHLQ